MQNKLRNTILFALASLCLALAGCQAPASNNAPQSVDPHAQEHGVQAQGAGLIGANVAHSTTLITGGHTNADHTNAGFMSSADKTKLDQFFVGPSQFPFEFDDFIFGGLNSSGAVAITTGTTFGKLAWRCSLGTNGTMTVVSTAQDSTHEGVMLLRLGATTTSTSGAIRAAAGLPTITFGSGQSRTVEYGIRIPTLSDGTNTYTEETGWSSGATALATDGCVTQYSSAAPSSGNFITRACAASSCTTGTGGSTVTASANTWYRVTNTFDGTQCCGAVNGTNIGCTSSNIPSLPVADTFKMIGSAGTANRDLLVDYAKLQAIWSTARFP